MKRQVTFSLFLNPFDPLLKARCCKCKEERFSPDLMRGDGVFICSSCVPAENREAMRHHANLCFADLPAGDKWAIRVKLYGVVRARQMTDEAAARKDISLGGLTWR